VNTISISEAAAILQPFAGDISAVNLLTEWRRKASTYRRRIDNPPLAIKQNGRICYSRADILHAALEMEAFSARHAKRKSRGLCLETVRSADAIAVELDPNAESWLLIVQRIRRKIIRQLRIAFGQGNVEVQAHG